MGDERATNALDRKLGERVRSRRLTLGMSQERLASLLGITFQQVQKYEKGQNRIAASRLFDIASVLGVSINFFYSGIEIAKRPSVKEAHRDLVDGMLASPDGSALAKLFASISSSELRVRVVRLVEALAEDNKNRTRQHK